MLRCYSWTHSQTLRCRDPKRYVCTVMATLNIVEMHARTKLWRNFPVKSRWCHGTYFLSGSDEIRVYFSVSFNMFHWRCTSRLFSFFGESRWYWYLWPTDKLLSHSLTLCVELYACSWPRHAAFYAGIFLASTPLTQSGWPRDVRPSGGYLVFFRVSFFPFKRLFITSIHHQNAVHADLGALRTVYEQNNSGLKCSPDG